MPAIGFQVQYRAASSGNSVCPHYALRHEPHAQPDPSRSGRVQRSPGVQEFDSHWFDDNFEWRCPAKSARVTTT